jgi:hypothetical protein
MALRPTYDVYLFTEGIINGLISVAAEALDDDLRQSSGSLVQGPSSSQVPQRRAWRLQTP